MKATNIIWDVDDISDLKHLPEEIDIPDGLENEDAISDFITEQTGFCHKGFVIEPEEDKKASEAKTTMPTWVKSRQAFQYPKTTDSVS